MNWTTVPVFIKSIIASQYVMVAIEDSGVTERCRLVYKVVDANAAYR
ncbi:hypothetical protein [Nitrosomonas sp. ANs5]